MAAVLSVALIAAASIVALSRPPAPGDDSVDAGFARDMATHHAQAVEMAEIIRQRTTDESLRILATDIVLTQQAQIGMMGGWLDAWELQRTRVDSEHASWMGMAMGATMPGMASRQDVASLKSLPLAEAERKFLKLMIAHHRGGVLMAQTALTRPITAPVKRLATSIVRSQKAEIVAMTAMLKQRGLGA